MFASFELDHEKIRITFEDWNGSPIEAFVAQGQRFLGLPYQEFCNLQKGELLISVKNEHRESVGGQFSSIDVEQEIKDGQLLTARFFDRNNAADLDSISIDMPIISRQQR